MTLKVDHYRAAILRATGPMHDAVRASWRIVDDAERRDVVEAAHTSAMAQLDALRKRFETAVAAERKRLIRQAFTPWASDPADRTSFEELVAQLTQRVESETDAYHELFVAQGRLVEQPHGPLAVYRIAWERGWLDIVELGRRSSDETRRFGRGGIDALLDFEDEIRHVGEFTVDRPIMLDVPIAEAAARAST